MDADGVLDGEAWREFCARVAAAGDRILGDEFPSDPRDRAEGVRHVANQVACWLTFAIGFTDVRVEQLPLVWRLASAGALFDAFANGAVRTAALLRAQTEDALVDIHTAIVEEAAAYRHGEAIELPMAAVLTSGTKP